VRIDEWTEQHKARFDEAVKGFATKHPTIAWVDLMTIHDLARSGEELRARLADPEGFVELYKAGKVPGQAYVYGRSISPDR